MNTTAFSQIEAPNIAASVKARRNPVVPEIDENNNIQVSNATIQQNIVNKPSTSEENPNDKKINCRNVNKIVWSLQDKILFFNALKYHGKNFVEVSRFMKNRSTRLNQKYGSKSKEQIRVFFIRMFNKVKQYIKFPMDIPQYVQELYTLINYGVFRTKVKKKLNTRLGEKLNELVNKGMTVIRSNGKRVILRTPVCPIFKQLNNINISEQEYTIPDNVTIELVPRNYITLWRVQMLELNPRLRMKVALNRLLADVMLLMNERFKHSFIRMKETLSLPINEELPTLSLRLVEPKKFFKKIVIREIMKTRFDSITLKAYCENNFNFKESSFPSSTSNNITNASNVSNDDGNNNAAPTLHAPFNSFSNNVGAAPTSGNSSSAYLSNVWRGNNDGTNNASTASTSTSVPILPNVIPISESDKKEHIKLDFEKLERQLIAGVDLNTSRQIKLLSIFIGLGCPNKIRFEYDYLEPSDYKITGGSHCVHNTLRRLVQLSQNDYLEHIQKTEIKSQLDRDIEQLHGELSALKVEVQELECRRNDLQDPQLMLSQSKTISLQGDNFTGSKSASSSDAQSFTNTNSIVYQKQNEAMQQFIDELPNKKDIVVRQLEFGKPCNFNYNPSRNIIPSNSAAKKPCDNASSSTPQVNNSSLASMKEFNKSRRNLLRVTQKKPAVIVQMQNTRGLSNKHSTVPNTTKASPRVSVSHPIKNDNSQDIPNYLMSNENTNDSLNSLLNAVNSYVTDQPQNDSSAPQSSHDSVRFISEDSNGMFSPDYIFGLENNERPW